MGGTWLVKGNSVSGEDFKIERFSNKMFFMVTLWGWYVMISLGRSEVAAGGDRCVGVGC